MNETKKEPTTAELFATASEELTGIEQQTHNLGLWKLSERTRDTHAAISELKRRMGEMERAIQNAPHGETCMVGRNALVKECNCWKARALTDAPPVFTLEEVEDLRDRCALAAFVACIEQTIADGEKCDAVADEVRKTPLPDALRSAGGGL